MANMIYKAKVCLGNIKIKNEFWAVLGSLKAAREQHMGKIFLTPIASPPGEARAPKRRLYFPAAWEGSRPNTSDSSHGFRSTSVVHQSRIPKT